MSNNTARHLYLLVNTEPERVKALPAARRVSGVGLVAAVIASLLLWASLLWGGAQILAALTR